MTLNIAPINGHATLRPGSLFFIAYAAFFFVSKFSGFLPGYALDDYKIISQLTPEELSSFYVSQGRFTSALVDGALALANLRLTDFYIVGLLAIGVLSGLFFRAALQFSSSTPRIFIIACAAVLGSHPYLAEYTTFRQSAFLMALFNLFCLGAFLAYLKADASPQKRWRYLLLSCSLAVLALGVNQLGAAYLCIALIAYHTSAIKLRTDSAAVVQPRNLARALVISGCYGTAITVGYLIVAVLSASAFGQSGDGRTELLSLAGLSQRIGEAATLVASIFVLDEVVASSVSKLLLLAGLLAALLPLSRQRLSSTAATLVFFAAATLIALLPILVSGTWWPVPRTLIVVIFATVTTLSLCQDGSGVQLRVAAVLALAGSVFFVGHSNALLGNQLRLNRWDIAKANQIAAVTTARFPDASRIVLSGTRWYHSSAPSIAQGDMNVSALAVGWAVDPLFDEATGKDVQVRLASDEENLICKGRFEFPHPDSLVETGDEVLVCLASASAHTEPEVVTPIEDEITRMADYRVFTRVDAGTLFVVPAPAGTPVVRVEALSGHELVIRAGSARCGGRVVIATTHQRIELDPDGSPSVVMAPSVEGADRGEISVSMADPAVPNWNCNVSFDYDPGRN